MRERLARAGHRRELAEKANPTAGSGDLATSSAGCLWGRRRSTSRGRALWTPGSPPATRPSPGRTRRASRDRCRPRGSFIIRALFRLEHDAGEQKIERSSAHHALRAERSKPLVEAFFEWATRMQAGVLPKGPLGEALTYASNQRTRLELFLTDPRIPIHNRSEARLRIIALARHNYLFFGHPRAGKNFAGLYSLVGSCIANGVEPTEYLTDVLPRIRDATARRSTRRSAAGPMAASRPRPLNRSAAYVNRGAGRTRTSWRLRTTDGSWAR
jgi:hypothetical protein